MPNHITTVCTVTGPKEDVAAFITKHIVPDTRDPANPNRFDLDTVVPRPPIVDMTESGSEADLGFWALTGLAHAEFAGLGGVPPLPLGFPEDARIVPHARVRDWLAEHQPGVLRKGELALRCLRETGHLSWYEWGVANWGTKWGAYQYKERARKIGKSVGVFIFEFQTAWSFPLPIFQKLTELYPGLKFDVISIDEGGPEYEGTFRGEQREFERKPNDIERYKLVYGEYPPADEED